MTFNQFKDLYEEMVPLGGHKTFVKGDSNMEPFALLKASFHVTMMGDVQL